MSDRSLFVVAPVFLTSIGLGIFLGMWTFSTGGIFLLAAGLALTAVGFGALLSIVRHAD